MFLRTSYLGSSFCLDYIYCATLDAVIEATSTHFMVINPKALGYYQRIKVKSANVKRMKIMGKTTGKRIYRADIITAVPSQKYVGQFS